jgi:proline racemase
MVETGMVMGEIPVTSFCLDSPSGLLRLRVARRGGRAHETTFENVVAFTVGVDLKVDVPDVDLNQRPGSDQEQVCVPRQANDPSC